MKNSNRYQNKSLTDRQRADLGGKCKHVTAGKWRVEGRHLIEQTTQRPDVSLLTVRCVLYYLRTTQAQTDKHSRHWAFTYYTNSDWCQSHRYEIFPWSL